jgi:hypothetical protein
MQKGPKKEKRVLIRDTKNIELPWEGDKSCFLGAPSLTYSKGPGGEGIRCCVRMNSIARH